MAGAAMKDSVFEPTTGKQLKQESLASNARFIVMFLDELEYEIRR